MFLKLDNIYEIAFLLRFLCVSFVSSSFPFLDRIGKYKTTEFTEKVTFILFSVHLNSLNDFYLFRINEIEQIWSLKESTEVFLIKILCALCGEIFLDINRTGKWVISERLGENQGSGLDLSEIDLHFTTYNRKDRLHMASKACQWRQARLFDFILEVKDAYRAM